MAATLSDKTIDLVKATVPALETHGLAITQRMYARMFENPDCRSPIQMSPLSPIEMSLVMDPPQRG